MSFKDLKVRLEKDKQSGTFGLFVDYKEFHYAKYSKEKKDLVWLYDLLYDLRYADKNKQNGKAK